MRHRVKKTTFNRDTKHRRAMLMGGVRNLLLHGSILTTQAKAKEFKRLTDKLVTTAKGNDLKARRELHKFFGKRDVVNFLVEQLVPLFKDRTSGFTRIVDYGIRRGDSAHIFKLELVAKPKKMGSFKNPSKKEVSK